MRTWLSLLALLLCSTAARAALAEPPARVAVLAIEIRGTGAPELRQQLERSIRAGLVSGGVEVLDLDETREALADAPELIGCTSTTCLTRIAKRLEAEAFLHASIEARGADYQLRFELLGAGGEEGLLRAAEESCSVCTIAELNDAASRLAAQVLADEPQPLQVVIDTDPPGAAIEIDGEAVGTAPFRGPLAPGTHQVVARLDGRADAQKSVKVAARPDDEPQRFELVLPAAAAIATPPPVRRYRTWKWATAGGAAALLVTGISLLVIDGDPTCDATPPVQCPDLRDTQSAGLFTVTLAAAAGGVSGWMFYRDRQDAAAERQDPAPPTSAGTGRAGWTWHF